MRLNQLTPKNGSALYLSPDQIRLIASALELAATQPPAPENQTAEYAQLLQAFKGLQPEYYVLDIE